jgi:2-iminobutanoate/2-iminopropanoate deaminase
MRISMGALMPAINPPGLKRQTYYNHAIAKPGVPVFLTGQVAWDENGAVVGVGDIDAQVAQVYANIGLALAALNATPSDIVKTVTYVTRSGLASSIHKGRLAFFGDADLPASTYLQVAGLADPDFLLEIDVVVMLPADSALLR